MATERLDIDAMVETLVEWMASGPDVTAEDYRRARQALDALGVPALVEALETTDRILLFGNSFHTIARFFADGSPEQEYLRRLMARSGEW
jgi:hypothetical protein